MESPKKIRVLCVDDSALVRSLMTEIIGGQPDMEVVATAPDPLIARELIKQHNPDVLTLDVEMPKMDGLDFLQRLMRLRPMPVVMVSSLTERNSDVTLRALELGAVDFVTKPRLGVRDGLMEYADMIADKIRAAAQARLLLPAGGPAVTPSRLLGDFSTTEKLILIGSSTGGTEAIRQVLQPLPANSPAILITQHMPAGFTRSFVQRLDSLCAVRVHEAEDGQRVLPGHVYLAPGGVAHMKLVRSGANYVVGLDTGEPVNRHRPSVDVLFHSAARVAGKNAIGAALIGYVGVKVIWAYRDDMLALSHMAPTEALARGLGLSALCCLLIAASLLVIVLIDVPWQLWNHAKQLRMSREDVRQEHKEDEGDPHVKGRIRQQQRAMAKRRMMSAVPKADVVVTNPTHYAVALRYREGQGGAPVVVAKGAGLVAAQIRELADEHQVALLEAPPLARALYHHVELDQEIPAALYAAVAEVLAWVYQLRSWRQGTGALPQQPRSLAVPPELDPHSGSGQGAPAVSLQAS
ncbi:Protein-glutamate methylesterase/protein-glutamine glutaminase [Castellaniella defragrans]